MVDGYIVLFIHVFLFQLCNYSLWKLLTIEWGISENSTILLKPRQFWCRGLFKDPQILTFSWIYIMNSVEIIRNDPFIIPVIEMNITTSDLMVQIPRHQLSLVANSHQIMPIKLFNILPMLMKWIVDMNKFPTQLMDWIRFTRLTNIWDISSLFAWDIYVYISLCG